MADGELTAHSKFSSASVLPEPFYCAVCGYAQRPRSIRRPIRLMGGDNPARCHAALDPLLQSRDGVEPVGSALTAAALGRGLAR